MARGIATPAVVELAEEDAVVHSLFVRRLLEHERTARKQQRASRRRPSINNRISLSATSSSVDIRTTAEQAQSNEEKPIDIQYIEGFFHGQILFHRKQTEKLFSKMKQMVQGYS
jgi:hypothetical protein